MKYFVYGHIPCSIEVEADCEEEAIQEFKEANRYEHPNGTMVQPVVDKVGVYDD
jgi:hypothetical protein